MIRKDGKIMSKSEYIWRRQVYCAARELGYSEHVIDMLKAAKNEAELTRIMVSARKGIIA